MTTAQECMAKIQEAAKNIRFLLSELTPVAAAVADAEIAYNQTYTRAIARYSEEKVEVGKALAAIDSEAQFEALKKAKAEERRIKEALHSERSILSGLQTVSTGYREEARFSRTGPGY